MPKKSGTRPEWRSESSKLPSSPPSDVDIILCMTNSNVPVIDGSWLEEGQYIISVVGSNIELVKSGNMAAPRREIDDETLKRCSFIVALSKEQAIDSQQGDIYWPVQNGVIGWDRVVDISDVLDARVKGRSGRQANHSLQEPGWTGHRRYRSGEEVLRSCQATRQGL